MASRSEEDFCCPVCHEVFRDPVLLTCGHSFCSDCLQSWWKAKPTHECPFCNRKSSRSDPPSNLVLKNLCESFVQERDETALKSEALCKIHSEKLKLFCLDHQLPVCVVCRDSEKHGGHRFRPVDEAAPQHKKKLEETLEPLKEKLKNLERVKGKMEQTAQHVKFQAKRTERQIKEQFKKLHKFLQYEEKARLTALTSDEIHKTLMIKRKMNALNKEIAALADTVRASEEQMKTEDVSFLINYKAAVERVQQNSPSVQPKHPSTIDDPPLLSGALLDEAKHLGNLAFNIWNKMKVMVSYTPLVLDPNTAHRRLTLHGDLTSLSLAEEQTLLPDNPERFCRYGSVLSSEGFDSGTHSWDVQVGDNTNWVLGVSTGPVQRKEDILYGLWGIWFFKGQFYTRSPPVSPTQLRVALKKKVQKIRVNLDWYGGTLSFYDIDTNIHIHTVINTFTERVFPHMSTWGDEIPLKILPVKVCVTVERVCQK